MTSSFHQKYQAILPDSNFLCKQLYMLSNLDFDHFGIGMLESLDELLSLLLNRVLLCKVAYCLGEEIDYRGSHTL